MSQVSGSKRFSPGTLRRHDTARTVLLRMAADEARAQRITELKQNRPDLTWGAIAEYVGVKERSVHHWRKTGGISYENAKKLAELFPETTFDHIWRGETPHLMGHLSNHDGARDTDARLEHLETQMAELIDLVRGLTAEVAGLAAPDEPTAQTSASKRSPRATGQEPT